MTCSIVIRSYNEEKHIGRLLTGILRQTTKDVEIVLVDSGSTDATVSIASRFPVRVVHVAPAEFTFGRSLNRGIAEATRALVVLASAHVYPDYEDWLEQLLAPFSDPRVALTYGKQRGYEGSKFSEHQVFRRWFPDQSNPAQDQPFCNNANAAIRRSVWEQIPYDETLTGLEDLAWAKSAQQRGFRIAYAAGAVITHVHEETPARIYARYEREAMALKRIFPETRFHLWDFARLLTANVFSDLREASRQRCLGRHSGDILSFRLMQFWGTYRGFALSGEMSAKLKQRFYYPDRPPAGPAPAETSPARRIDYADLDPRRGDDGAH